MKQSSVRYITTIKREPLASSEIGRGQNVMLLKTKDPFPGFYCPGDKLTDTSCKSESFYLPLNLNLKNGMDPLFKYSFIFRDSCKVLAAPALISLSGHSRMSIRLKGIGENISRAIAILAESDGNLLLEYEATTTYLGMIRSKSLSSVLQISKMAYQNAEQPNIYYIPIPQLFDWKIFEKLITFQKNSTTFNNYDAATGYWVGMDSFSNFLRIYSPGIEIEELEKTGELFKKLSIDYQHDHSII